MMLRWELVFITSPGAGHLPPTVELAKLLLQRDERLSVTIIILNLPLAGAKNNPQTTTTDPRIRFIDIPSDDSINMSPTNTLFALVEHHKPHVREIVRGITDSDSSVGLAGFVVDMFCMAMTDVANEFEAPTYTYFTSGAATLGMMFYLQAKRDQEGYDVTDLKNDSDSTLSVPSHVNPVPAKVLPEGLLDKEGRSKMFLDLWKRIRESKGIIVNTFQDLESHSLKYLLLSADIPPVFAVGPILNLEFNKDDSKTEEIMRWLNDQPERSVVFLCFGSMGSFNQKQVKEMAVAIERSGHRFLWSLRRPTSKENTNQYPTEYENLEEVLPEGFLERTSSVGKVIGWAPQMAVLSHPSVGGFVSHCGWNSTLESIWCGVPIAAWPLYAEQQLNAFELVVELGMATEIRMDYRTDMRACCGSAMMVTAEEIEDGIRKLMSDGETRKKVRDLKDKSRSAVVEDGSSHTSIGNFIDHLLNVSS